MLTFDDFHHNLIRLFRSDEWSRVLIPVSDEVLDVSHESRDGVKGTAWMSQWVA